ncbi:Gfo/Idh/MocA family oxidoreductase [Aliarcobacter butzleri]|uniref:Gfo/Idh/MocA family protein n=1 Tax=Aliarcobacter butzleri TaxID=28197 RepID=UPI001EDB85FB|nr:Gfo/Idh/MocA family oxidoreductase [Aliarcobacter butzleri]MCG3710624.1 Gfo/Idh/MocA family oxidoreductase [Aliarcobacter butzleri]MCG3714115.1 Gfo/Idh/MocA family oxidoreductase [Aliarcobacter butzleri]
MFNKINIGILGCANIAQRFIIPSLNEMEEFNIVGIASRTKEKADEFSKEFNIKSFHSYETLLDEPSLDAVYIPLPNRLHYEWIKKSFQKNLHILVEKSLACEYEEVVELNNLAKEKNLVLIENFQFRFHSQLKFLKDLVDLGRIGELRNIRTSFGFPPFLDTDNIRYKKDLGGGALLDAGAYPLKISQIFLGNDISVASACLSIPNDKEVDIWGSGYIIQNNGNIASQIAFGFDHFYQNNIEFWGTKGKIYTNRIFTASPGLEPTIEIETNDGKEIVKLPSDNHFRNMLKHFHTQITTKKNIEDEYLQNVNQARLINELKEKSNG